MDEAVRERPALRAHHHLWRDILKYIPSVLLPRMTGIITVPIITSLFRPELYGAYALVLANVAVLNSAALTGMGSSLLRFLPEYEGDSEGESRLLSTIFTLALGICAAVVVIGAAVVLAAMRDSEGGFARLMLIGLGLFVANGVFSLVAQVLRSARRAGMYSTIQLVSGYGGLAFGLLLVLVFKVGIQGLLIGSIVAALLGIALGWRVAMRGRTVRLGGFSPGILRHVIRYAFFVSIGNAAYWLLSYSDRWILQLNHGTHAVGLYAVGFDITGRTTMLFVSTFALALQPISISTWESSGREATERFLSASTRLYLLVMLPATVGLSLIAKRLVDLLAAPAYAPAAVVVPFVAFAMLLFGLLDIAGRGLTLSKRPDIEARNFFLAGLTSVASNLLLIPRYGIIAAAFSSLLGYAVLFTLHVISARPFARWRFPWPNFLRIAGACAAMSVVVLGIESQLGGWNRFAVLGTAIAAGALTYGASILALREITPAQLRELAFRAPAPPEREP